MRCPYENFSGPNCHRDFCECVGGAMREAKKKSRDRKVNGSLTFFKKNKIPYEKTKTENVVTTDYWGEKYYVSLKSFSFKKEGTNTWVEKKKQMLKLVSILNFGKHKGKKVEEVIKEDKKYVLWLIDNTDYLFDIEIHNIINKEDNS
jgi:hypothetical protein